MNEVILTGRLTRDPELRYTPKNTPVVTVTVATNEGKTAEGKDLTQFIPVEIWNGAENVAKYFSKGDPIIIRGRIVCDTWEKDGQKHSRVYCRVDRWEFPQSKPRTDEDPAPARGFADIDIDDGELPY